LRNTRAIPYAAEHVRVETRDEFGNTMPGVEVTAVALREGLPEIELATLTSPTTRPRAVVFDEMNPLIITEADEGYTLVFLADALETAPSEKFDVVAAAVDSVTVLNAQLRPAVTPVVAGTHIQFLDAADNPLPPGSEQTGVLAFSGPLPLGYHKDPDRTASTYRSRRST
jgi:hypothetical protein